jgi:hypothetical protein
MPSCQPFPVVLVVVLVLDLGVGWVLDLWTQLWSVYPSMEIEDENDDENDWEGTYIGLSTYRACPPGNVQTPETAELRSLRSYGNTVPFRYGIFPAAHVGHEREPYRNFTSYWIDSEPAIEPCTGRSRNQVQEARFTG